MATPERFRTLAPYTGERFFHRDRVRHSRARRTRAKTHTRHRAGMDFLVFSPSLLLPTNWREKNFAPDTALLQYPGVFFESSI